MKKADFKLNLSNHFDFLGQPQQQNRSTDSKKKSATNRQSKIHKISTTNIKKLKPEHTLTIQKALFQKCIIIKKHDKHAYKICKML